MKSVHISTGAKPKTEPTERSNSPEVISSVMASAIRPSSTVKASVLEMFCGERKLGLIAVKTTSSTTSSTSGPNSGRAIRRRIMELFPSTSWGGARSGVVNLTRPTSLRSG